MNLFEDLIDELKEDNLLEETVIETFDTFNKDNQSDTVSAKALNKVDKPLEPDLESEYPIEKNKNEVGDNKPEIVEEAIIVEPENIVVAVDKTIAQLEANIAEEVTIKDIKKDEVGIVSETEEKPSLDLETRNKETSSLPQVEPLIESKIEPKKVVVSEADFYRRRALDEVNGLEMVEHVLSGIEREYMKIVPSKYDDYKVKQALHEFLKVAEDTKSPEHSQSEFHFMQQTEDWYSALSKRDKDISVNHFRLFCETTKPSLSSQALMSLARFYRNSPYSESVRSKFDLVITKLFSKDIEGDKRELVFNAEDLVQHIQELYADWSSTPLYSTDEDDSELVLAAFTFQDFISEAENAESFDDLVKIDFFKKLKSFKEKTNENFFSPMLVAAAVECNVTVGNKYVELIDLGKKNQQGTALTDRYGVLHDKSITEATSKTLELLELLKDKKSMNGDSDNNSIDSSQETQNDSSKTTKKFKPRKKGLFGTSKWLIAATIITVIIGAVMFITSRSSSNAIGDGETSKNVKVVNLENSSLKEYVQSARISETTLFAITNNAWDTMNVTEKEEVVNKFLQTGADKGFEKVHFLNSKGETVGFGSRDGVNIVQ